MIPSIKEIIKKIMYPHPRLLGSVLKKELELDIEDLYEEQFDVWFLAHIVL